MSVFLPKTSFSMRGELCKKEPEILKLWENLEWSSNEPDYVLHWGPPYANGHIHMGHTLSYVLKDIVAKSYRMMGKKVHFKPGWDCHGLPIEWKIEEHYRALKKNREDVPLEEMIQSCRDFAKKWIDVQKEEFKRLGILADWNNPYITMEPEFESEIVKNFHIFCEKGYVYRSLKPVLWSVVEKTALAEAEVEYQEHVSDSVYVAFPIINKAELKDTFCVIWTTTPWTLPANRAIAYGKDIQYCLIEAQEKKFILAHDLLDEFAKKLDCTYSVLNTKINLEGVICRHPLYGKGYNFDVPLLPGAHVTTESGTGLVHTAPSHGLEDFVLGKEYNLEIPTLINEGGVYESFVPLFAGKHIYKVAPLVMQELGDYLLAHTKLKHNYPYSWRSRTPLIYRATSQWFIKLDHIREIALKEIEKVRWYPQRTINRIKGMVESRPEWCISRQRLWGVPLAIFVHKQSGEILKDLQVNKKITETIKEKGVEAWHTLDSSFFLGSKYNIDDYEKVKDVADVWFDSGCTHNIVLKEKWPVDLYLEGSDQHRGWFQSSLLHSCGIQEKAPYKAVATHGFVLDKDGRKMSKSLGNVVSPQEIVEKSGADIVRLWIVSTQYHDDIRIGQEIIKQTEDTYRRFRNTIRYLLGALDGYTPNECIAIDEMPDLEKWVLCRLFELQELHKDCLDRLDFFSFYQELFQFCNQDLSAFYFDIRKDTLYCDDIHNPKRCAARTVMKTVCDHILHWLAPILSFTAEEAWQTIHSNQSIHQSVFPVCEYYDKKLIDTWRRLKEYRSIATKALEEARQNKMIGSSLQARLLIYTCEKEFLKNYDLEELCIVSKIEFVESEQEFYVTVHGAEGAKCDRCWKVYENIDTLCKRCENIESKNEKK
jgi:isoleucyl-tRNA synthetase